MEAKYVLILDFTIGCLNIIELTDEELKASEEYEIFQISSQPSKISMVSD